MASRDKHVYLAKLADRAERYDEMADRMESVCKLGEELSVEERNLLSVAYKNAVSNRLAAWRIIEGAEQREKSKGNDDNLAWAREYKTKVEGELQKICNAILQLLDQSLIPKASNGESKVFYERMMAEFYNYMAEMKADYDAKTKAANSAAAASAEAAARVDKPVAMAPKKQPGWRPMNSKAMPATRRFLDKLYNLGVSDRSMETEAMAMAWEAWEDGAAHGSWEMETAVANAWADGFAAGIAESDPDLKRKKSGTEHCTDSSALGARCSVFPKTDYDLKRKRSGTER